MHGVDPLCSCSFKQVHPLLRIKQLGLELWTKVRVCESLQIVPLHEADDPGILATDPILPEPLAAALPSPVARHREQAPVDEDPHLGLIVPTRQRSARFEKPSIMLKLSYN